MSLNGSGVAAIDSAGQPVVATTLITATAFNALTADLATMISTCVMKDGQQTITQNIPFNNKKITGLAAASARTDGASIATIQDGTGVYVATVGGTADVITLTAAPAITAYAGGQYFSWLASGANTTNVTVNISGLGAKALTKNGSVALVAGDIASGMMVSARYDGTRFILNAAPAPITGVWTPSLGGTATYYTQTGEYTKIGNLVHIWCELAVNVIGTGSVNTVSGLPFTISVTWRGTGAVEFFSAAVATISMVAIGNAAATTVRIKSSPSAAAAIGTSNVFGSGTTVLFELTYRV